jgi:hypothetical protein
MGSILSRNEPSDKPGTIHECLRVLLSIEPDPAPALREATTALRAALAKLY